MLTSAQSKQINNTKVYTLDYETEAMQSYNAGEGDKMDQLEARADAIITELTSYDMRDDLGGITVYFRGKTLVAFYDYEQFRGTVF
jgi:hypothetical protein